ncbi:MAG TPA: zinc ribbon domain-containing protein [Burkholderiales bacterium]|nr:zinc ribbon domain-containing protein [Burkholderiales bacterium]
MPIYEYRCADCGFQDEYLQKVSEPPMTVCPSCGREAFRKLLTAAGFQLKGSGWYVTDFRNSGKSASKSPPAEGAKAQAGESKSEPKPESKSESKSDASSDTGAASASAAG